MFKPINILLGRRDRVQETYLITEVFRHREAFLFENEPQGDSYVNYHLFVSEIKLINFDVVASVFNLFSLSLQVIQVKLNIGSMAVHAD
jgi:hypothetical protein